MEDQRRTYRIREDVADDEGGAPWIGACPSATPKFKEALLAKARSACAQTYSVGLRSGA